MHKWLNLKTVIMVIGVTMGLYHLVYVQMRFQTPIEHQDTHLAFVLLLVFLTVLLKHPRRWPVIALLIVLSLTVTGYIKFGFSGLEWRIGLPTTADTIVGIILIALVIEATRAHFGWPLVITALIFIAYTFLGQYLPHPFWHFAIPARLIIANYATNFDIGMWGIYIGISANIILPFMVFGGLLQASGASRFFMECGKLAGRRIAGGPAMVAVVSSALLGTITGGAASNVAMVGPFTIPLMKKAGYTPVQAAAIEATASCGAALVPPVMGATAFVMAVLTQTPYIKICAMAIIPSVLYYFCIASFVQLTALKRRLKPASVAVDRRIVLATAPQFLTPLAVLTIMLVIGRSPAYAAFWGIVASLLVTPLSKEARGWRAFKIWAEGFTQGAKTGSQIGVLMALVGIMYASITTTGLGATIPALVEEFSGGKPVIGLVLVALVTLLLGSALPVMASYVLVAALAGPALVRMGIPLISAHFFILFCSVFSELTPPTGLGAAIAAPIAGAGYMRTSFEELKVGAVAFILPFLGIWVPMIILQPQELLWAILGIAVSFILVVLLQVCFVGYYFTTASLIARLLAGACGAALLFSLATQSIFALSAGLIVAALLTAWQFVKKCALAKRILALPPS